MRREAKAQLQLLKQESEASERKLREELQEQVDSLRNEQETEARDELGTELCSLLPVVTVSKPICVH